jgi:hypothetical protein
MARGLTVNLRHSTPRVSSIPNSIVRFWSVAVSFRCTELASRRSVLIWHTVAKALTGKSGEPFVNALGCGRTFTEMEGQKQNASLPGHLAASSARAFYWPVGNGCTPTCVSIHDGSCSDAPRWPHFVQTKFRRRTSDEALGPNLITNGASGIARQCEHSRALQSAHSQCGAWR